jgi:hypothetical protein
MHTCQRPFTAHGQSGWSLSCRAPYRGHTCALQSRKQHRPSMIHVSIRDFITTECPVPGFDGRYKERLRDATLELPCIVLDKDVAACPGATGLYTVNRSTFDAVIEQQGQVRASHPCSLAALLPKISPALRELPCTMRRT